MKVIITGAAGFLGQRLAQRLLQKGTLSGPDNIAQTLEQIVLLDIVSPPPCSDPRVRIIKGDIADSELLPHLLDVNPTSVFHLAAVMSGQAEADFDSGMHVNVDGFRVLLDTCRLSGHLLRIVFTSSIAVYGGRLPEVALDSTALNPESSYGCEKAIAELLLNDYTRKGFVDGRVLRLPTISVRPGVANEAASSFASGIVREPLNGNYSVCPVTPETRLWLLSPRRAIDSLITGHELPVAALGDSRVINVPGISVTVAEMIAALARVAGTQVARRIRWCHDPMVERIVRSWPGACDTTRALTLGFRGDHDFDSIIRAYLEDDGPRLPIN